jgi:hypothetical protein
MKQKIKKLMSHPLFSGSAIMFVGNMGSKLQKINIYLRLGIYLSLAIIAVIAQSLFFRGYFVS